MRGVNLMGIHGSQFCMQCVDGFLTNFHFSIGVFVSVNIHGQPFLYRLWVLGSHAMESPISLQSLQLILKDASASVTSDDEHNFTVAHFV